jgi:hypothetical protein
MGNLSESGAMTSEQWKRFWPAFTRARFSATWAIGNQIFGEDAIKLFDELVFLSARARYAGKVVSIVRTDPNGSLSRISFAVTLAAARGHTLD